MSAFLEGRHYVSALPTRWRGYAVKRTTSVLGDRRGLALRYVTVSRHFSWKAAQKAAHRRNAQEGRTQ